MRSNIFRRLLLLLLFAALSPAESCLATNEIYEQLVGQGIALSAQETVKLPQPVLADGLEGVQQRQAVESLLEGRYAWEEFTRKTVVSPLLLKTGDGERESGQVCRRVDLYFVAYGSLDALRDDQKLQEQLNLAAAADTEAGGSQVKILSAHELANRGLPARQQATDPRWIAVEATLLGKVQLNITTRNSKTQAEKSLLLASIVDPKFHGDAEYPNCWRGITVDDAGRRQVGPPQPYPGLGSYVKATQLAEPAGAAFIEFHVVYAEPEGWFHGANLLRSKLPIVAQDLVRRLRRKMAEN